MSNQNSNTSDHLTTALLAIAYALWGLFGIAVIVLLSAPEMPANLNYQAPITHPVVYTPLRVP
jgi:hypothetical protein